MTNLERFNQTTMTSLEIAEQTGKNHFDLLRAIRKMEVSWEKVNGSKFACVNYTDAKGEKRPVYNLTKEECLYIVTKFNDEARAKLIKRWHELEQNQHVLSAPIHDAIYFAKEASEILNLNDNSKLGMLQKVATHYKLPAILPEYTQSRDALFSATHLLKEYNVTFSAWEFNKQMVLLGLIAEKERNSSQGRVKRFKSLTKEGLQFGENQVSSNNPKETQPLYYESKFANLLKLINL